MNQQLCQSRQNIIFSIKYISLILLCNCIYLFILFITLFFTEIDLNKYCINLKVSNVFLDKFGNHALISLAGRNLETPSELLYYSIKNNKLKQVDIYIIII